MTTTKTTIYMNDELRKAVKKHIIDTGQTMSEYVEEAVRQAMETDMKALAKTKKRQKESTDELDRLIKELSRE